MSASQVQPVILCGGGGTRLWPLSVRLRPKQFLALASARPMIAETMARVADPARFCQPLAVGSLGHEALLAEHLPDARHIFEPVARNSAPPLAAAALAAAPGQLQLALPADHHIEDVDAFHRAVATAAEAAKAGRIVTFGVRPDHPATGYGYIEAEPGDDAVRGVARFVEKPDRETAETYLGTGRHFWNAGIFMYRADTMLSALETHAPDILASVRQAFPACEGPVYLDAEAFARCRADSIDYAVMEHADNISVVPVEMGWSDLGDYRSIHQIKRHERGPRVVSGPVAVSGAERCLVRSDGPVIAAHGVEGLAIIASRDSVLVTPLDEAADIKPAVEAAQSRAFAEQVEPETRARVLSWFADEVVGHWLGVARDPDSAGFVESLDMSGAPEPQRPRRGRVAPRQVYAFAEIARQGFDTSGAAAELVEAGLDYLDAQARSPRGGWAHELDPSGRPADERRCLYDHAFVALAGAAAFRAVGDRRGRALAEEAFDVIDRTMRDPEGLGWFAPETDGSDTRLANPHMHLLEASIAFHEATGDPAALERALEIALLFETRLFDPRTGAVLETFDAAWRPAAGPAGRAIEPGHCYEWAVLLREIERLSGRDTRSWRTRLIGYADRRGRHDDGRAMNRVDLEGGAIDPASRLWPQLEMFRAKMFHRDCAEPDEVGAILTMIESRYLKLGPQGGWVDALDASGAPAASHVPASMLYHLVTALGPLAAGR